MRSKSRGLSNSSPVSTGRLEILTERYSLDFPALGKQNMVRIRWSTGHETEWSVNTLHREEALKGPAK